MTSDPLDQRADDDSHLSADHRQNSDNQDRADRSSAVPEGGAGPDVENSHPEAEAFSETEATVISKRRRSGTSYPQSATPSELGEALEGRRLDYFELKEFVGGGGMGAVFRAIDTKLGRTVAVKILSPYQTDEANLRRFKNEAQSAARLDHANIARVYYVGEDDGWHFIVFEFIEGVNLRDLVNHKGPLPVQEALTYTLQAAAALDHAAQRDLVHRDIKPSNVLITPEGQAKLVDMGLARLHQMESNSADLTASGVTLGTFDYISPEQARDPRNADVRSDLYSLGCTLYFMLTGMPPFPGGTVLQKLLSHSSDAPAELRSFRDDVDDELVRIVDRMLTKQPADRYQTPAELIVELSSLGSKLGMSDNTPGFTHWIETPPRQESWFERHLPWAIPLLALVLVVLVLDRVTQSRSALTLAEPHFNEQPFQQSGAKTTEPTLSGESETGQPPPEQGASQNPGAVDDSDSSPSDGNPAIDLEREGSKPPAGDDTVPGSNKTPGDDLSGTDAANPAISDPASTSGEVPSSTGPDDDLSTKPLAVLVQVNSSISPPRTLTAESLSAAIELVHQHPSITTIEIAQSGSIVVNPFMLRLGPESGRRLTIRAREAATPLLVFRPSDFDLETPSPTMIHLTGGNLTIQDLHLRLELPDVFRQSWSLFSLQDVERLLLDNSSLTVTTGTGTEPPAPVSGVAFFDFLTPKVADATDSPDDSEQMPRPVPQLILQDSLARGPATLVRTAGAIPFKLRWNNGLLVTNERLLETVGSETKPRWQDGVIDIELQHLTAAVREGLCLMKGSERRPFAVEVMANCQNCIFITDSATPLYVQRGFTNAESIVLRPKITGSSNYYQNTDLVLKVEPRDFADENQLFTFEYIQSNRNATFIRPWYDEMNYRPGTMISWRQQQVPPTDLPLPLQTVNDYLLNDQDSSFEMEPPGVIADQLPAIPATTVQPILPAPVSPEPTP